MDATTTYIFLQEGMNGSFVKDASGNYTLTIDAGFIEMDRFLKGFGFDASNPPNPSVLIEEGKEDSDAIVVELTSPQYDKTNSTLTYTAKTIYDYAFESEWPKDLLSSADKAIPEHFDRVAIVIDNIARLHCADSTVTCCRGWGKGCCGDIPTGCCWNWADLQCEACHDYTSECKAKFGNSCDSPQDNCGTVR